ncbi:MAG TPA: ABC transporter ATP-binding protein [Bacteroidales bacterium]|jgi:ABC-2 type transport system ATP-binding protein|nr:ABC transporter ATP-binding protein [Bacteroidales bacterium]
MIAIETRNITKAYGEIKAVDEVSIIVNKGEVYTVLGMNGAGKSTLIKMLCGLVKPTSGEGLILGYNLIKETGKVKKVIAVSPQETAIAFNLTVYENLELLAGLNGFTKKERKGKVNEMMDIFSLEPYSKKRSKELSGGWQRRLSIAMALVSEPDILFLDEPTIGLDVLARRELWQVIKDLKNKVTIILTTHYLEEAENLSDRICILQKGKVSALGTVDELMAQTQTSSLEDAFINSVKEVINDENIDV